MTQPNKFVTTKELLDWGLLFEINRRVLHPLGLALEAEVTEDGNVSFTNRVWNARRDPEGIIFVDKAFEHGKAKFDAMMEEWGEDRLRARKEALGYLIQGEEDE